MKTLTIPNEYVMKNFWNKEHKWCLLCTLVMQSCKRSSAYKPKSYCVMNSKCQTFKPEHIFLPNSIYLFHKPGQRTDPASHPASLCSLRADFGFGVRDTPTSTWPYQLYWGKHLANNLALQHHFLNYVLLIMLLTFLWGSSSLVRAVLTQLI